jgi:ubiquinol-cytochrome c reductase cytochrome b/c1 subunit
MKRTLTALPLATLLALVALPAVAQEGNGNVPPTPNPPRQSWSFHGPFGTYNQGQLQRGFKVYKEVCANCHSMELLAFRNLADPGGPGFSEAQAESLAATYKIKDLDDQGQPTERTGRPADNFPSPFPNELAAKAANGGAAPPDMSTLAKARGFQRGFPWFIFDAFTAYQEQGPDYIHAILNGYVKPPAGFTVPPGKHYNEYFPSHVIAMPPPLQDGQVTYDDGSPQTLDQYSKDVAAFLMWAAEPKLDQRHRVGFQVLIFLIIFSGLLYFTKKKVWHEVEAPREAAHGQDPAKTSI